MLGGLVVLLFASTAAAQPRGYRARACGFDLNFNGIVGEPADCNICDGVTTDVDGNGVADDLRYVDCNSGGDTGACTAASPCRTPQYALNSIGTPSTNQIQAICVRGLCDATNERSLTLTQNGAAGTASRAASGSEAYAFEYPRYPLMIVGWDSDNDGQYPPFDANDTAVFDGNDAGNSWLWWRGDNRSRVETAHFTVRDYNRGCANEATIEPQDNNGPDHVYFHDITFPGAATGCGEGRFVSAFGANGISYHAFENLEWPNVGGFIIYRGDATESVGAQFIRWKNITVVVSGSLDQVTKHWNNWSNVEWLDSHIQGVASGVSIAQCNQGWTVRNNMFLNNGIGIGFNIVDADSCNQPGRPTDNIVIDRNTFHCGVASCRGDFQSSLQFGFGGTGTNNTYLGAVKITNNFFSVAGGSQGRAILVDVPMQGSGTTGKTITIVNNSFHGAFSDGGIVTFDYAGSGSRVPAGWVVQNNLFSGGSAVDSTAATLSNYTASANRWQSGMATDQVVGASCSSAPAYVGASTGDLHLQASDTCAQNLGVAVAASITTLDFDGQPRPQGGGWDVGGDEVGTGGGGGIAPPVLLDVTVQP